MKYYILVILLLLFSVFVFSQKRNNKIETYHEECCVTPDSLMRKFNSRHVFYIYKPRIDSCEVFLERKGDKVRLPIRKMKYANYYVVSLSDSTINDSCSISIMSLKYQNRNIKFQLDSKYFFVRTAFLERGWVLEYTNKMMTIL